MDWCWAKWIIKSNYPVQHQGINACLHGMKVQLYQLGPGLSMCQWRVSLQCSESLCHGHGGVGPSIFTCKHRLLFAPLNRCTVKVAKYCSCPSPLLIFAPLHLLFSHLGCSLFPRTESLNNWGVAATFAAPRTSAACLRPCDQVGKGGYQVDCFSVLTEGQSTTLHPIGRW